MLFIFVVFLCEINHEFIAVECLPLNISLDIFNLIYDNSVNKTPNDYFRAMLTKIIS